MLDLHDDEKIIREERRFWLPIAMEGVGLFAAGLAPFALLIFYSYLPDGAASFVGAYLPLLLFAATGWLLIVWVIFFIAFTNYYLDALLVTNKRIVDIEQIGLFSRDLAELRIENIQDIKVEVVGLLASLLNFGNLHIQTAAINKEFVIKNIPDPHGVKDTIAKQHDELIAAK